MKNDATFVRMRTQVASIFIFSKSFQTKKIKALRPKMTKIASKGPALIAIDANGFRRMKEEVLIYQMFPQIFQFLPWDLVMIFQSLALILPRFFDSERP